MGHEIPVSFGAVDRAQLPECLEKWHHALPVLEADFSNPPSKRFYEAWSRNWFDLYIMGEMCADHEITGLEFLSREVACVCGDALQAANNALDAIVEVILTGAPSTNPNPLYDAAWNLLPESVALLTAPRHPIDNLRKAEDNFFGFLRLLRRAVREAADQERCLLFVAPQP